MNVLNFLLLLYPGLTLSVMLCLEHAKLLEQAHGAIRSFLWQKDQETVCDVILAIVSEAQTS